MLCDSSNSVCLNSLKNSQTLMKVYLKDFVHPNTFTSLSLLWLMLYCYCKLNLTVVCWCCMVLCVCVCVYVVGCCRVCCVKSDNVWI